MALEGFPDCSHSWMAFMISTIPMFHLLEISSEQILYILLFNWYFSVYASKT